jgi:hypothetical protein
MGKIRNVYKILVVNSAGEDHLEYIGRDKWIILKIISAR